MTYRRVFLIKVTNGYAIKTKQTAFEHADLNETCELLARLMDVDLDMIKSESRKKTVKNPRHIICYMVRKYTGHSYEAVGRLLHRHHSTIMNSENVVKDWIDTGDDLVNMLYQVEQEFAKQAGTITTHPPKASKKRSTYNNRVKRNRVAAEVHNIKKKPTRTKTHLEVLEEKYAHV